MKLVIHDLKEEEWNRISNRFGECKVISDTGSIRPCIGCFSCWAKTPGQCVVKDGYDEMGRLIHDADEVIVLSRYTYGGFSGFVKNVFDRCLGYVLPQFELVGGESHHKKRYDEDKAFTFIFYGNGMGPEERESAKRYVTAVCTNIRGYVKEVIFEENGEARKAEVLKVAPSSGKVLLLNGSMRSVNGNTAALMKELKTQFKTECETAALRDHLKDLSALLPGVEKSGSLVICVPLYVDGLPAQTIRFMEMMEREYRGGKKKVYVLANMGLYESRQLVNLFSAVRQWCGSMGFEYCGALGVSAGELVGALMKEIKFGFWVTRDIAKGMKTLAEAVDAGTAIEDIYAQPHNFPRSIYIAIANTNWNKIARQNGISPKELYRRL